MGLLHAIAGVVLLIAHGGFAIRGVFLLRRGASPTGVDRLLRLLAHLMLPVTILTGIVSLVGKGSSVGATHVVLGLAPVVAILASAPARRFKRRVPWLLPMVNLACIAAAVVTGLR